MEPTASICPMTSSSVCGSSETTFASDTPELVQRALHLPARHRADAAQVLRQDHVGLFPAEELLVQDVDGLVRVHPLADRLVDLA